MSAGAARFFARPQVVAMTMTLLVSAAAWIALAGAMGEARFTWELLRSLCLPDTGVNWAMAPRAMAMWALMCAAMMLPTAAPVLALYASLIGREARGARLAALIGAFIGGYLAVWSAASVIGALAQVALARAGADGLDVAGAGLLLVLAGLYQLTPLKNACLNLCHNPMSFFLAHWREGAGGALAMGLRHGVVCIGCCWALMALMLLFGAMNLVWMAALGAYMLFEKSAPIAVGLGRVVGAVLAGAGVVMMGLSAI